MKYLYHYYATAHLIGGGSATADGVITWDGKLDDNGYIEIKEIIKAHLDERIGGRSYMFDGSPICIERLTFLHEVERIQE